MNRFNLWLDHVWAIPTWMVTNIMVRFVPITHPWRDRWFPLKDWAAKRTDLVRILDTMFWWAGIMSWILVYRIFLSH